MCLLRPAMALCTSSFDLVGPRIRAILHKARHISVYYVPAVKLSRGTARFSRMGSGFLSSRCPCTSAALSCWATLPPSGRAQFPETIAVSTDVGNCRQGICLTFPAAVLCTTKFTGRDKPREYQHADQISFF